MIQAVDTIGTIQIVLAIGTPVATVVGAYFTIKFAVNGQAKDIKHTRETMGEIKEDTSLLKVGQNELRVELGKATQSLDDTRGWVGQVEQRLDRHIEMDT